MAGDYSHRGRLVRFIPESENLAAPDHLTFGEPDEPLLAMRKIAPKKNFGKLFIFILASISMTAQ